MEPDHASLIAEVVEKYPEVKIVTSGKAITMLGNFFPTKDLKANCLEIKNGDTLELGEHTLTFVAAPMVHWPEVMVSYDSKDKVLFSADGFGKFGALSADEDCYQSYWNYAEKKGYSGTAIYTKHTPLSVSYGIGIDEHDHEGRVITLEYDKFYLVTVYTPNSQDGLRRLDYRMKWEDDFRAYLKALDVKKPVIVCGDMNTLTLPGLS